MGVLHDCIAELSGWMSHNRLKLNENKTEMMVIVSPKLRHHLPDNISLSVCNSQVETSDHVRNLGVIFDSSLSTSKQVTALSQSLNFHLYNISRVRRFLTEEVCHHVVRSLVLSRLDYSNSLLINAPVTEVQRLQRIQNRATRVVLRARRQDHASPLLRQLHWLQVEKRIIYKTALFVYKCTHNVAPEYLSSLLQSSRHSSYNLRSTTDTTALHAPRLKSKIGARNFHYSGPVTWNRLPCELRCSMSIEVFKKLLKTHLFTL